MFGYVLPLKEELKVRHYEQYRAAYCGLCRSLGRQFGFAARFTVSYDLVFLYLLLSGMEPEKPCGSCRCPARPWKKCKCVQEDAAMQRTAAANVILTYWKLRDGEKDEHGFRRLGEKLARLLLTGAYAKASRQEPELAETVQQQLAELSRLEDAGDASMDRYADAFCGIMRAMGDCFSEPELARPVRELLNDVGRYLYLTDALDDLKKDMREGAFNPLALRFPIENGMLSSEDQQYLLTSIDQSLDRAAAALELLPLKSSDALLHNIVYFGLPAVLKSVAAGTFHDRSRETRSRL